MEAGSLSDRSLRLESFPFSRLAVLKRDTTAAQLLAPFSWWAGDQPRPRLLKQLRRFIGPDPGMIYAAPLDLYDARRMQALLQALGLPFVLHLWDLLDVNQQDAPSMRWLIEHARHIFCISQEIAEAVSGDRASTSLLRCHRPPSREQAQAPDGSGPMRIVMIGDCGSYASGMSLLNEGVKLAKTRGIEVQLVYIGREKATLGWRDQLEQPLEISGFLESDDDRDRALAANHIAFLPGPQAAPESDPRSRFSIPSRVLDFMATGLPILGTVHPDSATAHYIQELGAECFIPTDTAEAFAEALSALASRPVWEQAAAASLEGFERNFHEKDLFLPWMTGQLS